MTAIQTLMLIIYVLGVLFMIGLHFLASMMTVADSSRGYPFRVFITVFLWPFVIVALIIARIVFKIRNPYAEDDE